MGKSGQRVLVVEDEAMQALDIEQMLTDAGYQAILADNASMALQEAGSWHEPAAAAIIDLHLIEGMQGGTLITRLRELWPGLPVVVVTGYSPRDPAADLRGLGGPTARLHKPLQTDRLLQRLQDAIQSSTGVA
jgi:CheY-like chemotaxis protein